MELHEKVIGRRSPVDVQHRKRHVRVLGHGASQVAHLVGDRFQGRPHDVGPPGAAGEAEDGSAGVGIPPGSAQPRERRHDEHAVGCGHAAGDCVGVGDALDDAELVAEPLDEGTGHEHAALERVLGATRAGGRGRHGGHETVLARAGLVPGMHEQEAAGAVGVLGLTLGKAPLPEQCSLLVPGNAGHRHLHPAQVGGAVDLAGIRHAGQDAAGDVQRFELGAGTFHHRPVAVRTHNDCHFTNHLYPTSLSLSPATKNKKGCDALTPRPFISFWTD